VPVDAIVALGFGKTRDPFTGRDKQHQGLDFAASAGTPVVATAAGKVTLAENNTLWGNRIIIAHADSISTVYAHLGAIRTARGRLVKRGETIRTIGFSGLTTGPHVHYEIRRNGVPVDPAMFLYPVRAAGTK
jgi:murein DD-endopeptidase MepM/ murein hydrolase activator NlpD